MYVYNTVWLLLPLPLLCSSVSRESLKSLSCITSFCFVLRTADFNQDQPQSSGRKKKKKKHPLEACTLSSEHLTVDNDFPLLQHPSVARDSPTDCWHAQSRAGTVQTITGPVSSWFQWLHLLRKTALRSSSLCFPPLALFLPLLSQCSLSLVGSRISSLGLSAPVVTLSQLLQQLWICTCFHSPQKDSSLIKAEHRISYGFKYKTF